MSAMTRGQVERECQWLVEEHCQSAARKWDAHDALQRQRIAQLEEQITYLQTVSTEQVERIRTLVAFYDKHHGTPCEQIRHQQEVEELKRRITQLEGQIDDLKYELIEERP